MDKYSVFSNKKIVMLQGPVGPFFKDLSTYLTSTYGTEVTKINFNGGDSFFYQDGINFTDDISLLNSFLKNNFSSNVDYFVLFGDCRKHHMIAKKFAYDHGIGVVVFEEGYLRPNYITMEINGVNANSHIPKNKTFYQNNSVVEDTHHPVDVKNFSIAIKIIIYALFSFLAIPIFRHYRHHRSFGVYSGLKFLKAWIRRRVERRSDIQEYQKFLTKECCNKDRHLFFVPMQVSTDAQVLCHSNICCMEDFVHNVLSYFKISSQKDDRILFKDHPLEIERDYKQIVLSVARELDISDRVFFVRMVNVSDIINQSDGIITINSTVGLSALLHKKPVFALGEAIYKFDGLAVGEDLNQFIINPEAYTPDGEIPNGFKNYLLKTNQIVGSFYI